MTLSSEDDLPDFRQLERGYAVQLAHPRQLPQQSLAKLRGLKCLAQVER
jgi:hypothetical protein